MIVEHPTDEQRDALIDQFPNGFALLYRSAVNEVRILTNIPQDELRAFISTIKGQLESHETN